jgi:CTP synthase (UTP-ammonia lyase)
MKQMVRIALIGDYNRDVLAHQAIPRALVLARQATGVRVDGCWLATARIDDAPDALLDAFDAFWCVPASPYESASGALRAIRYARENDRPFLGTCGGFQHAVVELARNVLGIAEAGHAELDPHAGALFVAPLSCSLVEVTGRVRIDPGTLLHECYGADETMEGYHCNYGLNEERRAEMERAGIVFSGFAEDGTVRAMEIPSHKWFVATLFQPERAALRNEISPLVAAMINAAAGRTNKSPLDALAPNGD